MFPPPPPPRRSTQVGFIRPLIESLEARALLSTTVVDTPEQAEFVQSVADVQALDVSATPSDEVALLSEAADDLHAVSADGQELSTSSLEALNELYAALTSIIANFADGEPTDADWTTLEDAVTSVSVASASLLGDADGMASPGGDTGDADNDNGDNPPLQYAHPNNPSITDPNGGDSNEDGTVNWFDLAHHQLMTALDLFRQGDFHHGAMHMNRATAELDAARTAEGS